MSSAGTLKAGTCLLLSGSPLKYADLGAWMIARYGLQAKRSSTQNPSPRQVAQS